MKKLIYIWFLCLLNLQLFAQNYSIENNKVDSFVADYAAEIIKSNTPTDSRHYAYTLTQNDKEFVVSCIVTPDNINVTEQTNDVWNEMENTIVRAINKVQQSLASQQTQTISIATDQQISQQAQSAPQNNAVIAPTQPVAQYSVQQPYPQQQAQSYQSQPAQAYLQNNNQPQPVQNNVNVYNSQATPNGNMGYMQSQNYTIEDVSSGKATIGGKIWFSDGTCGVIFFLDGIGHGLAVSLDEKEVKWQDARKDKYCQDIYQLMNEGEPSKFCNLGLGAQQTQMIINQLGWGQAPAAEWCVRHGNGWYLPSAGELWHLLTVANYNTFNTAIGNALSNSKVIGNVLTNPQEGFISKMLQAAGGQPLDSSWYWSSSEEEQGSAWNVSATGKLSSEDKTNEVAVRAVRYF